jgi:hypothetical protein
MRLPTAPSLRRAALLAVVALACGGQPDASADGAAAAPSARGSVAPEPAAGDASVSVTLTGTGGNDGSYSTGAPGLSCFQDTAATGNQPEYRVSYGDDANPQVKWLNLSIGRTTGGTSDRVSGQISAGTALGPGETSTGMLTLNGLAGGSIGRGTARVERDGDRARIDVDGTSEGARVQVRVSCTVTRL